MAKGNNFHFDVFPKNTKIKWFFSSRTRMSFFMWYSINIYNLDPVWNPLLDYDEIEKRGWR